MTTVTVASSEALFEAFRTLAASAEGGTILLAPSDTPYVFESFHYGSDQIDAPVTITSLDADDPAVFAQIKLRAHENVTFDGVEVQAGQADLGGRYDSMVSFYDTTNMRITNSTIQSDAAGVPGLEDETTFHLGASALSVRASEGFHFENNVVSHANHAIGLLEVSDVTIAGNDISQVQGDFVRMGGVQDVEIRQNHFHDPLGSTQGFNHSDFIQLWGTRIQSNNERIHIADNILDSSGASYQMIFGRNEDQATNGFVFQDITIENNVLYGAHYQTIGLSQMDNVRVVNNTVVYNIDAVSHHPDGSTSAGAAGWIRVPDAQTLTLENNIALSIHSDGENNVVTSPSEQGAVFVNVFAGGSGDLRDLLIPVDHPYHGQLGSSLLWMPDSTEALTAMARPVYSRTDNSVVTLDGGYSTYSEGRAVEVEGALFEWVFEDGTVVAAPEVTYDFVTPGRHSYTLRVTLPDGQVDEITRTIDIDVGTPIRLQTEGGVLVNTGEDSAAGFELGDGLAVIDDGFVLRPGGTLQVSRDNDWLYDSAAFDYGLTLSPLEGSYGDVLYLHPNTLRAAVTEDGAVTLSLQTTEGRVELRTEAGVFAGEGDTHRLNFQFDGEAGFARILVDGEIAAIATASGETPPLAYWGMTVGHPWNGTLSAEVTDIVLSNESPLAARPSEAAPEMVYQVDFAHLDESDDFARQSDALVETEFGTALDITDGRSMVPRDVDFLFGQEAFEIALTLNVQDMPAGHLLYLHKTLSAELREDGRITFTLITDQGSQTVVSSITDLEAGALHELRLGYDGALETMQIRLDGEVIGQGIQSGVTPEKLYWGLNLGHPWSGENANVLIHRVEGYEAPEIDVPASAPDSDAILFLDFEDGTVINAINNDAEPIVEGSPTFVSEAGDTALAFERDGAIVVDREAQSLFDTDGFVFAADVALSELGTQEIFRIHQSMKLTAHEGKTKFSFTNDDNTTFTVEDSGGALTVGEEHAVRVVYDADLEILQLLIDGAVVDAAQAWGNTKEQAYWGMNIGGVFGSSFAGTMDNILFAGSADASEFANETDLSVDTLPGVFLMEDTLL